jgi:hypothetical protein
MCDLTLMIIFIYDPLFVGYLSFSQYGMWCYNEKETIFHQITTSNLNLIASQV